MGTIAAYTLGLQAQRRGDGFNLNPYDPYDEEYKHDAWFDGWAVAAESEANGKA